MRTILLCNRIRMCLSISYHIYFAKTSQKPAGVSQTLHSRDSREEEMATLVTVSMKNPAVYAPRGRENGSACTLSAQSLRPWRSEPGFRTCEPVSCQSQSALLACGLERGYPVSSLWPRHGLTSLVREREKNCIAMSGRPARGSRRGSSPICTRNNSHLLPAGRTARCADTCGREHPPGLFLSCAAGAPVWPNGPGRKAETRRAPNRKNAAPILFAAAG